MGNIERIDPPANLPQKMIFFYKKWIYLSLIYILMRAEKNWTNVKKMGENLLKIDRFQLKMFKMHYLPANLPQKNDFFSKKNEYLWLVYISIRAEKKLN